MKLILTFLTTVASLSASALMIDFDPVGYTGTYSVGASGTLTGFNTLDLAVGNHTVFFAPGTSFQINVDAGGNVTSLNTDAATGSGSTLTFNNTTITVEPAAYIGTYFVNAVDNSSLAGTRNFVVLPGISDYSLSFAPGTSFRFNVSATGDVTSGNADAATGSGSTLKFNTTVINVDPGAFAGNYTVVAVDPVLASGSRNFVVLPGVPDYILTLGPGVSERFSVGAPCSVTPSTIMLGGGTFNLSCVPQELELTATGDSFLRQGNRNRNEGANPLMRIQASGNNRAVAKFDATAIADFVSSGLTKATLTFTIQENADNWGQAGDRTVDAHPLNEIFTEGDGKSAGLPGSESTRGTGAGVTWKCATDTDISNQQTDCASPWDGGDFGAATATPQVIANGQTGEISWDVTADVLAGSTAWLVKKTAEGQNGKAWFYSREGAAEEGDSSLAPRLVLE